MKKPPMNPKITTLADYQAAAQRTLPIRGKQNFFIEPISLGNTSVTEYTSRSQQSVDLLHAALGLCTEAGELADPIKKAMFYGKPLDIQNLKEEAGDLLWYIAAPLCRALNCTLEELAQANADKLRRRYPEKFTEAAAIARADKTEGET